MKQCFANPNQTFLQFPLQTIQQQSFYLLLRVEAWLNGDGTGPGDFPLAVLHFKKMVCHSRKSSTHNKSTILMDPSSNPYINISWSMSLYHSLKINLYASSFALILSTNSSTVISGSKLGNLVGSPCISNYKYKKNI